MSSCESMIKKLEPLGIYNLATDSILYAELAAFSEGLDVLKAELDTVLKEAFISTAESYGIENLELLVGKKRDDLAIDKRRSMLIERLSFGTGDFTPTGLESMLRVLGVDGKIEEYPFVQRIVLNLSSQYYSAPMREWIMLQAEALFPAHLDWDVVFWGFTWAESDGTQLTFEQMDSKSYSWDSIDYKL